MANVEQNLLNNYPSFRPDIENFNHVVCNYVKPDALFSITSNSLINFMMFNIRSIRKNFFSVFSSFFLCFCSFFLYLIDRNLA